LIELPDEEMAACIAMSRIAAVWIAAPPWGTPIHTGAANNLLNVDLARLEAGGSLQFEWAGWVPVLTIAEWLSWAPLQMFVSPQKRIVVSATLADVIHEIREVADAKGIRILDHTAVLFRAGLTARKIEQVMRELQMHGDLQMFNGAYKRNREPQKLPPYEIVRGQLRKLIAGRVLRGDTHNIGDLADEIRRRFPWMRG
jgi:hypothetical protein